MAPARTRVVSATPVIPAPEGKGAATADASMLEDARAVIAAEGRAVLGLAGHLGASFCRAAGACPGELRDRADPSRCWARVDLSGGALGGSTNSPQASTLPSVKSVLFRG